MLMAGSGSTSTENDLLWHEVEPRETGSPLWYDRVAWLGLILVGCAAFLSEVGLCLALVLACLNFGRERFRVGRWLKRHDPWRLRGKVCSRFYFAWGVWRITYVSCLMAFLLGMFQGMTEGPSKGSANPPPSPVFIVAGMLTMLGIPLTSFVTALATISALRHRVKVWLGPQAGWARQARRWPPHTVALREPTSNSVRILLYLTMIMGSLMAIFSMIVFPTALTENSPQNKGGPSYLIIGFLGLLFAIPFAILKLSDFLQKRIIAATPEACWSIPVDSGRPEPLRGL
jgi:hypothetical protein